ALAGTVFERSACALYLVGVRPDGGFIVERANRAALSGGDPDDAAGRTPAEVFGPERGERLESYFARCVREALPVVFEETLSVDGTSRVFRTLLTPVVETGRTVRLAVASGDITSHQLSEDALRDNLRRSEILLDLLRRDDGSQDAFLERTLKQAMILTDSEAGALFLLDEKQETLLPQSMLGSWYRNTSESEQPAPLSLDRAGPWAEAVRTGRPVRTTVADVPVTADGPDDAPRAANLLCLPVYDIGRVIAVLGVGNREKEYTDQTALQLAFLINNAWNVVERLRADERLRAERDLLQATLLSIGDGIVATDRDGRVLLLNDVACRMTGWGGGEAVGKPLSEVLRLIDEHTREPYVFTGQDPAVPLVAVPEDLLLVARDGTTCPVSDSVAPIRSLDGKDAGIVVAFRDVTQDRHRQESITYLSYHDPLTGLYNRRFFEEELRRLNTRRNLPITLVMADMNALKLTNDAFGHGTGDRLLRAAADALRAGCREDDIIARLGGDEFIILLPHTSYEEASTVVTRVQELCGASRVDSVALSISFGWDTKTDPAEDIQDTYRRAEDRMYRQKLFDSPGVRSHAVQTIIQALFRAQPREESHSRRVAALCETLGQALGLPDHVVRELRTAGMLYDIGKIGIREDILDKRERLTEDEQAEVRRHSEIGYRILSSVNELSEIADYILLHHERWDGSGYPKGLAGTLTPLPSRIIGLADAYDAMVSERPYRAALPPDEALRIIQDQSGTQFDPDLVKVFAERVAGRAAEQP
ncbi:MAG: diguanylate cyclase, partial [Clostridia bacterium]|nr:diguanylate cyclase [Clostridia bacterium]